MGLVASLEQTAAWLSGEDVPGLRIRFPPGGDVAAIRRRTGFSQAAFARQIGVSVATLRNWEQGRREPTGPAKALLTAISRDPKHVLKALAVA